MYEDVMNHYFIIKPKKNIKMNDILSKKNVI